MENILFYCILLFDIIRKAAYLFSFTMRALLKWLRNFGTIRRSEQIQLDGTSTARSRKWCLRHRAILQTKTEEIFQIQVQL